MTVTAVQLALDDPEPDWATPEDCHPSDRHPARFDCRQHEMRDLRGQSAGPHALWTAETVPTGRYL